MIYKPYTPEPTSPNWKILFLLLFIGTLVYVGYNTVSQYTQGLPRTEKAAGLTSAPRRNPEQRRANMDAMMVQLGMSEAQKTQVRVLWKEAAPGTPETMRTRFDALRKVATPEQQVKFREIAQARFSQRMEELKTKLPAEDFAALQQRMQRIRATAEQNGAHATVRPAA